MGTEIERKFLLRDSRWRSEVARSSTLRQGYLAAQPSGTVRVRLDRGQGWLTIKGPTQGIARTEFEYPIPESDAVAMLEELCVGPILEKTRHVVPFGGLDWEIDEFLGDNLGLTVAEVELRDVDHCFEPPPWLGREVSGLTRYYNSALVERPFRNWTSAERRGESESGDVTTRAS